MHTPAEARASMIDDGTQPGKVTGFFLAAWLGSGSKQFSLCPIGPDGTSEVRVTVNPGDVDTLKLAVTFNMAAPKGTRNCHLASSFIPLSDLAEFLSAPNPVCASAGVARTTPALALTPASKTPQFSADQACFAMGDNFTRNSAVLRFVDAGSSNLSELSRLKLRPSALRSLDRTCGAVSRLGKELKAQISQFAVSPLNAGPQYMQAFTYGQMEGLMTHYALLGHAFSCMPSPVDLPWVMYDAYQTVQSTGLSLQALSALSDADLVLRFGLPMISRHTACALTTIYCTDYTVNAVGQACKLRETEDIAQTFSSLSMLTQPGLAAAAPFVPAPARLVTIPECIGALTDAQRARRKSGLANRFSFSKVVDDCENLSQAILFKADGIRNVYLGLFAGAAPDTDASSARKLASLMSRCAAQVNPHLYARLTQAHHEAMAPILVRLGRLLHSGVWSNCLAVVSAKGPSYDSENPAASAGGLSGHGTVIARVKDLATGHFVHCPVEGTTYFSVDQDPPQGFARSWNIRLADGSSKSFDHAELASTIAQNVHDTAGVSCDNHMLAHIRADYGPDPFKCPFYVSAFYTGLSEGSTGSLGCVPLDTAPPPSFGAGTRPVFGAPVTGLSRPSTVAVPVKAEMLAETNNGCANTHHEILGLLRDQVSEAWSPEIDPKTAATVASYWQPCESPDHPGVCFGNPADSARCIRSENTWAFDRPEHTAMAVQLYRELAENFNALQARDPASDGSRAHAYGQYLSASLRITLPVPRASSQKPVSLSCVRNLRQAVTNLGVGKLAACPLKAAAITARAKVVSDAPFYMCDRGSGFVHAHRVKLA